MSKYTPIYDPPFATDYAEAREHSFNSSDRELSMHLGFFIAWFAAAEFIFTLMFHTFAGRIPPRQFHALTKGMDARVKIERFKKCVDIAGWTISEPLLDRLTHWEQCIVPLRNKLVHSHLYWPDGGDLQITTIGTPPIYEDLRFDAPDPEKVKGMELFERAIWLKAFGQDIGALFKTIPRPLPPQGQLGIARYLSSMPKGYRPKSARKGRLSMSGKPARKPRGKE